jgi:hypothetical protein
LEFSLLHLCILVTIIPYLELGEEFVSSVYLVVMIGINGTLEIKGTGYF